MSKGIAIYNDVIVINNQSEKKKEINHEVNYIS